MRTCFVLLLLCAGCANLASAQGLTPGKPIEASASSSASSGSTSATVYPTLSTECAELDKEASRPTITSIQGKDPAAIQGRIAPRDEVRLTLANAGRLMACIRASRTDPVLFIDHMPLPDLRPRAMHLDDKQSLSLVYRLDRGAASAASWSELMLASWRQGGEPRQVSVGIGPSPLLELAARDAKASVELVLGPGSPAWAWGALAACAVALGGLVCCSNALRDRALPAGGAGAANTSFSLARTLLSVWSLTATAAIALVFLNTGAVPALDGGIALVLLASGLTLGTGAAVEIVRSITFGTADRNPLRDLLTDADGLAMHRAQALVVNLLLLGVVWWELINRGSISNLDKHWASLMGVSSGVYLYGKATESV